MITKWGRCLWVSCLLKQVKWVGAEPENGAIALADVTCIGTQRTRRSYTDATCNIPVSRYLSLSLGAKSCHPTPTPLATTGPETCKDVQLWVFYFFPFGAKGGELTDCFLFSSDSQQMFWLETFPEWQNTRFERNIFMKYVPQWDGSCLRIKTLLPSPTALAHSSLQITHFPSYTCVVLI